MLVGRWNGIGVYNSAPAPGFAGLAVYGTVTTAPPSPSPTVYDVVRLTDGTAYYQAAKESQFPAVLGQQLLSASLSVVLASNQPAVPSSNAAGTQVDGHSVSIGATTDANTANTVIGILKRTPLDTWERPGASLVRGSVAGQTVTATVYTVTVGKTFYCTSIIISAVNTNTAAQGRIDIIDNTSGSAGTVLYSAQLSAATAVVGTGSVVPATMPSPLAFTVGVRAVVVTGALTYACNVQGFEK